MPRYVVECEWAKDVGDRRLICHRTVVNETDPYGAIQAICLDDGSRLAVRMRECVPEETVEEIHAHDSFLNRIIASGLKGFVQVSALGEQHTGEAPVRGSGWD